MPRAFAVIVAEGIAAGVFREVDPVAAYFTIVAPIVFFQASAPIRRQLGAMHLMPAASEQPDAFVRHVQETIRRAFAPDGVRKGKTR